VYFTKLIKDKYQPAMIKSSATQIRLTRVKRSVNEFIIGTVLGPLLIVRGDTTRICGGTKFKRGMTILGLFI